MAAPSTVYKDFKTRRRKAGTPDVDIDLFIAKFLQNTTPPSGDNWGDGYFNSTDTEAQKIAKIKDIFKIDGWVNADTPIQKAGTITISGTSVTGSGTAFTTDFVKGQKVGALVLTDGVLKCVETYIITAITSATAMSVVAGTNRSGIAYANYHQGFIGYCFSRNSGNGLYHNWDNNTSPFVARGSGVRVPTTAQASAELLNDAGLNTKGDVILGPYSPNVEPNLVNYGIKLSAIIRAAYYTDNNVWGIKVKADGTDNPAHGANYTESQYTEVYQEPLVRKQKKVLDRTPIPFDQNYPLIAPNNYLTQVYATNDEGITLKQSWRVQMNLYSDSVTYGSTLSEAATVGLGASTIYLNTNSLIWKDAITGNPADSSTTMSFAYQNIGGSIPVEYAGFYMFTSIVNNKREYIEVSGSNSGAIIGWSKRSEGGGYDVGIVTLNLDTSAVYQYAVVLDLVLDDSWAWGDGSYTEGTARIVNSSGEIITNVIISGDGIGDTLNQPIYFKFWGNVSGTRTFRVYKNGVPLGSSGVSRNVLSAPNSTGSSLVNINFGLTGFGFQSSDTFTVVVT